MEPDVEPGARWARLGALSDRLGVAPSSVVAGALAVVAASGAAWWVLRAPAPPPVETILPAAGTVTVATPPPTTTLPEPLVVHVEGEVVAPGVYELEAGSRVVDAVAVAGGLTAEADRDRINLAARLNDGERIWIPAAGETEPAVVAGGLGGGSGEDGDSGAGAPIDINRADASTLEQLPGIGPALAAAIVEHRTRDGPFSSVDGLLDVSGIGPAKLAQLEGLVTV